ncbi:MAG: M15 family metallopeptidase [Patescibacteria group bacterium]
MEQIILDSQLPKEEILKQNPNMPAPLDVIDNLEIITLIYYGFDSILHQGQMVMHKKAVNDLKAFFQLAFKIKFPIEKVIPIAYKKYKWNDDLSCNDNNSSGYNFRFIAGTNRMSKHALGLAFDINPAQNPYIRYNEKKEEVFRAPSFALYDKQNLGTLYKDHPLVVLLKSHGWEWGGDWDIEGGRIDYQHFEFCL